VTRSRLVPVLVILGVLAVGCGGNAASAPEVAPRTSAARTQLVLEPAAGKPVITFTGRVNGGRPLLADMASFNALPSHTVTVFEPFVKKRQTFTGVSFADLLDAAKATGTSVTIHALDDYRATMKTSVLREPGVLLATRVSGEPIELDSGGPVRLVFPASSTIGKDSDLWVWSIDHISVE
jgi:hypothetical protein